MYACLFLGAVASVSMCAVMCDLRRSHRATEKVSALLKDPPKSTDERWDLRSLPAFTIDDPSTTDVDDALSFARAPDGTEWVRVPIRGFARGPLRFADRFTFTLPTPRVSSCLSLSWTRLQERAAPLCVPCPSRV